LPVASNFTADLGRVFQRVLPIALLALALVGAPILIFQPEGLPRMRALGQELSEVNAENTELRRDVGKLRVQTRDLRDDPAAVERIARDQLGLVRKSEVVFQFGQGKQRD
jgi:cell division protein FtsB